MTRSLPAFFAALALLSPTGRADSAPSATPSPAPAQATPAASPAPAPSAALAPAPSKLETGPDAATPTKTTPATISVSLDANGKAISPDLFGIFFEDLNYAADGGLYAELIQNRSFEYQSTEQTWWNNLTSWETLQRGGGKGSVKIEAAFPLHPNNPHYAVLSVETPGEGVGLANNGFDGIPVLADESYDLSFFARECFFGKRWVDVGKSGKLPLLARLETKEGEILAEASLEVSEREWKRFTATFVLKKSCPNARLVLLASAPGGIAFDEVSLFPKKTFHDRKNGLRPDLAQTIADLKPRFVRFPGGCLVHGNGLGNLYRWKDTIGPIEQRKQQANLWGYHQTVGLGYFEYFQFCEDIGAKPLPVVAAGVCCQNSGTGAGQAGLPLSELDAYIQDIMDLIEWANGPANSTWGAKRAAAGHPKPFGLKYLGIGNEDQISPVFRERFAIIHSVVKAKHPEITLVGTVGPFPDGEDFDKGWALARDLKVAMVDEHYYKSPQWFWSNLQRYDGYKRNATKVYVGEYAAHDDKKRGTLRAAIAEAAYLTSLEKNGDVVRMASYAPLLARRNHTQWTPDLIYFDAQSVYPSLSYTIQQLFSVNAGDAVLPLTIDQGPQAGRLACSAVKDSQSGEIIIKLVNGEETPRSVKLRLNAKQQPPANAICTVFAGPNADVANEDGKLSAVVPTSNTFLLDREVVYDAPANSLTILRIMTK